MTIQEAILFGLSVGFSVLGWFARQLWNAVETLRKELAGLEVRISREYVPYERLTDRLQETMRPITEQLNRIESNLSHKADK